MKTNLQHRNDICNQYNISTTFYEFITDKKYLYNIINDIKSDKSVDIEIVQFVQNTSHYESLDIELLKTRNELDKTNESSKRKLLHIEISQLESELKTHKINVLLTASNLLHINDTRSISQAKTYFFNNKIENAINCLNPEADFKTLLSEAQDSILDNANEFMVKAQLTSINLDIKNPHDRFNKSVEFFEKGNTSVQKSGTKNLIHQVEYLLNFGLYLDNYNKYNISIEKYNRALELALELTQSEKKSLPLVSDTYNNIGNIHSIYKNYHEAETCFLKALQIDREILSIDVSEDSLNRLADTLNNLGILNIELNKLDDAEHLQNQSLDIRSRHIEKLSDKDIDVANSYGSIGIIEIKKKNIEASFESLNKALKIYKSKNDWTEDNIVMVLNIMISLSILYKSTDDYTRAETILLDCEWVYKELVIRNPIKYNKELANIYEYLGNIYSDINELKNAETYHSKSLNIKHQLAEEDPEQYLLQIAASYNDLALIYKKMIMYDNSEEYYLIAIEKYKELITDQTDVIKADLANTHNGLGALYYNSFFYNKSKEEYLKSLELFYEIEYKNNEDIQHQISNVKNNLGILLVEMKELDLAEIHLNESLEIVKKLANKKSKIYSKGLAINLMNLGVYYSEIKNYKKSQKRFNKAERIFKRLSKINVSKYEPLLANYYNVFGMSLMKEGYHDKALEALDQCKFLYKKLISEDLTEYIGELANIYLNIGSIHNSKSNLDLAHNNYLIALETYEKLDNENDTYIRYKSLALNNIGLVCGQKGHFKEAISQYMHSLATLKLLNNKPDSHQSDLAIIYDNIGDVYHDLEDNTNAEKYYEKAIVIRKTEI